MRRRPIQPIRRRGRPTKQEQQTQRLEQHRLLREEQQRELRAQVEEYGQGDLFIDDEEPQVPEWVRSVERERRNKQSKKRTKQTRTKNTVKEERDQMTYYIVNMNFYKKNKSLYAF